MVNSYVWWHLHGNISWNIPFISHMNIMNIPSYYCHIHPYNRQVSEIFPMIFPLKLPKIMGSFHINMGGFHKWGYTPKWMVYFMENPIVRNGWWPGVPPWRFGNLQIFMNMWHELFFQHLWNLMSPSYFWIPFIWIHVGVSINGGPQRNHPFCGWDFPRHKSSRNWGTSMTMEVPPYLLGSWSPLSPWLIPYNPYIWWLIPIYILLTINHDYGNPPDGFPRNPAVRLQVLHVRLHQGSGFAQGVVDHFGHGTTWGRCERLRRDFAVKMPWICHEDAMDKP